LSELVRPILSKKTNGRDIHIKLVRYIVKQRGSAYVPVPLKGHINLGPFTQHTVPTTHVRFIEYIENTAVFTLYASPNCCSQKPNMSRCLRTLCCDVSAQFPVL